MRGSILPSPLSGYFSRGVEDGHRGLVFRSSRPGNDWIEGALGVPDTVVDRPLGSK